MKEKTAKVYGELARLARSWGYDAVTAPAVHDWRKRGLLPPVHVRRPGFGKTETEIPDELVARLRAVCRLRYNHRIADLRVIGLILWLDGEELAITTVRPGARAAATGLSRYLRRTGSRLVERMDDPDADVDAAALRLARQGATLADSFGGWAPDAESLETALDEFMRGMAGRTQPAELDAAALAPLEQAVALDRARADPVSGARPWLTGGEGEALKQAVAFVNEAELIQRLDRASDRDLESARAVTDALNRSFWIAGRFLTFAFPPGAFGLGFLGLLASGSPLGKVLIFLNAIALPDESQATAEAFREATANLETLLQLGRRWLDEHPEHAADAERRGLKAVLDDVASAGN